MLQSLTPTKLLFFIFGLAALIYFSFLGTQASVQFGVGGGEVVLNATPASTGSTLEDGLIGHWTFDGPDISGSAAVDSSVSGYNGTLVNGPVVDRGIMGQALSFDGSDDYVEIGTQEVYNVDPSESKTFSVWIKRSEIPVSNEYFLWKEGSCIGWSFAMNTAGRILQRIRVSAAGCTGFVTKDMLTSASVNYADDTWHHVVGVFDRTNTTMILYVDGVQATSTIIDNTLAANGGTFRVGTQWDNTEPFGGAVDDVRVFNRTLTPEEVAQLYAMGEGARIATTPKPPASSLSDGLVGHWTFDGPDVDWGSTTAEIKDVSGAGNDGNATATMNNHDSVQGVIGQALDFDGVSDYVSLGSVNLSVVAPAAGTVCAWHRPSRPHDSGAIDWIVNRDQASDFEFQMGHHSNNSIYFGFYSYGRYFQAATADLWSVNEWLLYCTVWGGSSIKGYVNGEVLGSSSFSVLSGNVRIRIASQSSVSDNYYKGSVDDVRVYNRALTAAEIQQLYDMGW